MTVAFLASQTLLKLGDGASPQSFNTIGEVVSIGPLAQKKDLIEVTHMTSLAKEYIGGLSDGQEMEVVCNYIPSNPSQAAMIIAAASITAAKDFKYVLPSGGSNMYFNFSALVLSSAIGPVTPNAPTQVTFGLKITGAIVGPYN